eukprot:gene5428-5439_t
MRAHWRDGPQWLKLVAPLVIGIGFRHSMDYMDLVFVGHIGSDSDPRYPDAGPQDFLAGIGVAQTWMGVCCMPLIYGCSSAVQARGAGNIPLMHYWLRMASVVVVVSAAVVSPLFWLSLLWLIPLGISASCISYLQAQHVVVPAVCVTIMAAMVSLLYETFLVQWVACCHPVLTLCISHLAFDPSN